MGSARYIYNNYITAGSMFTVSSVRSGRITKAVASQTGSAVLSPTGAFSGSSDLVYVVEIDSVGGGAEVGLATFKWSDDGGSTWDATGVTTATTATLLNNGVKVYWTSGSGDDFAVGDKWVFRAVNLNSPAKMLDLNRDTTYKSNTLDDPNTIVVDLGSAQAVDTFLLFDHNLSSAATITIQANSSDSWGAPAYSQAVTWATDKILYYLAAAQTYRYWRVVISDQTNTDGHISIGELYLGDYWEPSKNFAYHATETLDDVTETQQTQYGKEWIRYYNERRMFQLVYNLLPDSDITSLKTLYAGIKSKSTGVIKPIFFNEDSAETADLWLMHISPLVYTKAYLDQNTVNLSLREAVKSA